MILQDPCKCYFRHSYNGLKCKAHLALWADLWRCCYLNSLCVLGLTCNKPMTVPSPIPFKSHRTRSCGFNCGFKHSLIPASYTFRYRLVFIICMFPHLYTSPWTVLCVTCFVCMCLDRWVRAHMRAKHHPHSLILLNTNL